MTASITYHFRKMPDRYKNYWLGLFILCISKEISTVQSLFTQLEFFMLNHTITEMIYKTRCTSPFNSSTEGTLFKCMLQTAHNACNSKDVDALKFQLVRHDIFYNGQNQEDSTECLLMLINIIDKGSMPDSNSTTSPTGASLSDVLFSFVLETYIVCDICPPHLNLVVCCIFHLLTPLLCNTWF